MYYMSKWPDFWNTFNFSKRLLGLFREIQLDKFHENRLRIDWEILAEMVRYKLTWCGPYGVQPPPRLPNNHVVVSDGQVLNLNTEPYIPTDILVKYISTTGKRHFLCLWCKGSPSGWNRFQPQIGRVQNRGTFLDCHIGKYRGVIRSKIFFFRISNISVPCPHDQLRGRTVIKKLWTFFGPWGRDCSQSPPCWIFRVKQIHPSTASDRTTRQVQGYVD